MEFSVMECTLKEQDGIKQSTWLMSQSLSNCMLSYHLFGSFQKETERSQLLVFICVLYIKYCLEPVLCLQQVIQQISLCTLNYQAKKIKITGSEEE